MIKSLAYQKEFAFNAICPYFTMFPMEYPFGIIRKHIKDANVILDPFCGRGTTIYAARKLGIPSFGIDSSPIASTIARAKLSRASVEEVLSLGEKLLAKRPRKVPTSAFFRRAFSKRTLVEICSLREGLLAERSRSGATAILRAAALGCLHGPLINGNGGPSYFSNQMPRTFASKPDYSLRFWRDKGLFPPSASVIGVLRKKLQRISDLNSDPVGAARNIKCFDARVARSYRNIPNASVTITSPPYYGMRTYIQDQWLRMWFLGGEDEVNYECNEQLTHTGHEVFVNDLAKVWRNVRANSVDGAHLYVRFGSLPSAKSDAKKLLKESLEHARGWKLVSVRSAASSAAGKRQADYMGTESRAADEFDFHAVID